LVEQPPLRIASLDRPTLNAELSASASGAQLLQLTGAPVCGVDFYYLKFWTVGAANETTQSTGALMVPTGAAPACSGPRPMLLYAHATQTNKAANIADITDPTNTEGALIAAMFAAQGYIVVAPNYAGYDVSTLGYHPFLNATQQSGEMIDALAAARTALPATFSAATSDNGKLFLAGYSEGGYVAMATERALEVAGKTVTAAAPMSGPYALEAFGDAVFFGQVNVGATVFEPLLTTGYQHAYGNIYSATTDVYSTNYASGIDTLLPSATPVSALFSSGKLPQTALFNSSTPSTGNGTLDAELAVPSNPLFAVGFGNPYLINNSYRVTYVLDAAADPDGVISGHSVALAATAPAQSLRNALYQNDMRRWWGALVPAAPTFLCGGGNDPTVFYSVNTGTMAAFWKGLPAGLVTSLDVDPSATPSGTFAALQLGFQASQQQQLAFYQTAAGGGLSASAAQQLLVQNYHSSVAPFCALAARSFFAAF
jgi:hypothetical protein